MTVDQAGIDFTKGFEGFSAAPYKDVAGILTVGYGHKIKPNEDFSMGITLSQAETLLYDDMEGVEAVILKLAPDCNQNQFNALADFGFNLGVGALEEMLAHGLSNAPVEMLHWDHAHVNGKFVEVKGLTRRRLAEVALFEKEAA